MIKAKIIGKDITKNDAEKKVTKSLLSTMSVKRLQDTQFISVPSVRVCDSRPSHISVDVEKLAGMNEIDKRKEDIKSSTRGQLVNYSVPTTLISTDVHT